MPCRLHHAISEARCTAEAWGYQNSGGDASGRDLTNVASAMCGWQAS
jgi:hypothetical protein